TGSPRIAGHGPARTTTHRTERRLIGRRGRTGSSNGLRRAERGALIGAGRRRASAPARPETCRSPMPEIDDLPDKPGHLIRLAQQRSAATFAKAARRYNITGVQHIIMVALNKYPDIDVSTL